MPHADSVARKKNALEAEDAVSRAHGALQVQHLQQHLQVLHLAQPIQAVQHTTVRLTEQQTHS